MVPRPVRDTTLSCPILPPRYLDASWHCSIIQQQLQDVEADNEHRDALGGAGSE